MTGYDYDVLNGVGLKLIAENDIENALLGAMADNKAKAKLTSEGLEGYDELVIVVEVS